jgi:DNA polymerase
MRWSERQQLMLREMGLRLWSPAGTMLPPDEVGPGADAQVDVRPAAPAGASDSKGAGLPMQMTVPPVPVSEASGNQPAQAGAASVTSRDSAPQIALPVAEAGTPRTAGAVSHMGWFELREAVAACRACSLCESRKQTVFGVGNEQAHWMIVGEAPGEQEDLRGEPFVGAAGRLLDRMLLALGLTRGSAEPAQQVFIANTLKCRPPRNRNPEPDELLRCQPFLERQVELVQPKVILAMGRFAVQSLLQSTEPVGRLRGKVHQWRGRPLIVTYHPAYLLRNPADKARAWADLCLAAHTADR